MGAFEYIAVDSGGKERKGVLEGDTPRQVRQLLRDQKLLPLEVTEVARKQGKRSKSISLRRGLSASDLSLITRQLATLVHSALPLEEALLAVSEQTDKPRIKSMLLGVRARVMEGHTLADGLSDFPQAFPEIYRATVAAGEQSGHLDAVLERLADYAESRQILRQKIANAMIYPIILVLMAVGIVSGLMVFVVPKVVGVFENTSRELPGATRALIATSDFLRDYGIWLVVALIVIAVGTWQLLKNEEIRSNVHRTMLRLPLIGYLIRGLNTARFTRTLSILAGSGVPVLESLKISGEVVANLPMRRAVEDAAVRVREGASISSSLGASKLFPPMSIHLISSGESSGELEAMLERSATNQEREMDGTIAVMLGILEPLMIILMGLLVLAIVFAMLLPIFQLNDLVQ